MVIYLYICLWISSPLQTRHLSWMSFSVWLKIRRVHFPGTKRGKTRNQDEWVSYGSRCRKLHLVEEEERNEEKRREEASQREKEKEKEAPRNLLVKNAMTFQTKKTDHLEDVSVSEYLPFFTW